MDLAALDFFVGAMAVVVNVVTIVDCQQSEGFALYSTNDQGSNSEYFNHMTVLNLTSWVDLPEIVVCLKSA